MHVRGPATVLAIVVTIGAAARARADDKPEDDRLRRLEEAVAKHDDELARARVALEIERQARLHTERPLVRMSGYVQADWVAFRQSSQDEINGATGQPLNQDRFLLRRGHLRADADHGLFLASLEVDANTVNGPQVRPIDAEASIRWPGRPEEGRLSIMGTLGLMKIPFGFEVPELDNRRPFLERSAVMRALFPGEFDLGFRVKGAWRFLTYAVALMNGDPIGERLFPGQDPAKSKDLVVHAGIDTKVARGWRLEAGMSGVNGQGFHKGTPSTKDVLVWRDTNEDGIVQPTEIQVISGTAATPSQTFHRFGLGADLRLHVDVPRFGELTVRGEIVWASNLDRGLMPADPVAAGRDVREFGWYVGATQEVTRWAMFGVRYDRYNPDADTSEQRGATRVPKDSTFSTLAFMAMARYATARLIVELDHNTNALGRTPAGLPTTLADDALTVRGEVSF